MKMMTRRFVLAVAMLAASPALAQDAGDEAAMRMKISATEGEFCGPLQPDANFGQAATGLGDIDGDGNEDIVVGAHGMWLGTGAITVLRLDATGTVVWELRTQAPDWDDGDGFGCAVAYLGDLDGPGEAAFALAVGALRDDDTLPSTNFFDGGAVYILFFDNTGRILPGTVSYDGTAAHTKLGGLSPELPLKLNNWGHSVAAIGDLNGDGNMDIAVGEPHNDDGGDRNGAVWILFLDTDGTVIDYERISDTNGFPGELESVDHFGWSVAHVGTLNANCGTAIAVGAKGDDDGGPDHGAVYILCLNPDGTVASYQKISDEEGGFPDAPPLISESTMGYSVGGLGDLDGDGVPDIAVGQSRQDRTWLLFLNPDGTVKGHNVLESHADGDLFGSSIAVLGDLGDDGFPEIVVGARHDDDGENDGGCNDGGIDAGAVYVVSLHGAAPCIGDGDGDGVIDFNDLLAILAAWGPCVGCPEDIDGDGTVGFADLLAVLAAWGPCV